MTSNFFIETKWHFLLKFIKADMRDYVMCATAVYSNPVAIKYIPMEHIDDEIMEYVINAGEKYVQLIPPEFLMNITFT